MTSYLRWRFERLQWHLRHLTWGGALSMLAVTGFVALLLGSTLVLVLEERFEVTMSPGLILLTLVVVWVLVLLWVWI